MVQDEELTTDRSTPVAHFRFQSATVIQIIKTPVRVPRATAIAERFVGTLRRELLDRPLIINQRHAARRASPIRAPSPRSSPYRALGQAAPLRPLPRRTTTEIHNVLVHEYLWHPRARADALSIPAGPHCTRSMSPRSCTAPRKRSENASD
jgi:hypothetical protein